MRRVLLSSFLSVFLQSGIFLTGQDNSSYLSDPPLQILKFEHPVVFDGRPDEKAWMQTEPIKLVMFSPVFGKEPVEHTDVRIGYDDKYLFIAGNIFYRDPSMIRSASFKRDYLGMGGDWFGVFLDTYNDKENSLAFFTSPDAIRFDASIMKDAVPNTSDQMPMNLSWNTFWDVLTDINSEGWSVEIRIPLSSLRFQSENGETRMGIIIQRWIPARNETDIFPPIPPRWGQMSAMKPSQAKEIILKGLLPDKPLYIAPYALGGYNSVYELNNAGTEYLKTDKPVIEAGLDIKYGLSGNMVMDLTVNTDFAQVEADDQQFNMTRFSLYFPEKRLFFLERASIFDFNLGANNTLFYSRRIGLSEDGDPVRIYGGGRIIGRLGKWDLGFLNMQTAPLRMKNPRGETEEILPSENFGVLRFRRQVINENSYIGAAFTSRLGINGNYNIGYGIDGIFRLYGQDYLDIRMAQTFETGITAEKLLDPARISIDWSRRSEKGIGYTMGYSYSGINFNPGIGFEMMDNYYSARTTIKYGWLPGEKAKLYSHNLSLRTRYSEYLPDGMWMSYSNTLSWEFQTKSQWQGNFEAVYSRENLRDSLELLEDKVWIPHGQYDFFSVQAMLTTPGSKPFFVMMMSEAGKFFDGSRVSLRIEPTWNISKHFEFGAVCNLDYADFRKRNSTMVNNIAGIKVLYMLNTRFSINTYIQYNTAYEEIISNLRIRYNPKEGNDLYLVFNEGRNTALSSEIPNRPVYSGRTVLIKYTYTFNL